MLATENNGGIAARAIAALRLNERRASPRREIRLPVRFMSQDRDEYVGETLNVSGTGAEIVTTARPAVGERVVIDSRDLGWIDAIVCRTTGCGFAVAFVGSPTRMERISKRLDWVEARLFSGATERRADERIVPTLRDSRLTAGDESSDIRIVDVSRSGAALESALRPPLGMPVTVGRRRAEVIRHIEGGFAVKFAHPFPDATFDESITL